MAQNLVLFHVESLSHLLFWQFHAELPALWDLKNRSMYFSQCYSPGASTQFTGIGLSYGTLERIDSLSEYGLPLSETRSQSLFEQLRDGAGYRTIYMPTHHYMKAEGKPCIGNFPMVPGLTEVVSYQQIKELSDTSLFEQLKSGEEPFALYIRIQKDLAHCDMSPEFWAAHANLDPASIQRQVMREVNQTAGNILNYLKQHSLLDDTLLIMFGDHGWDFNGGKAKAPEFSVGTYTTGESTHVPMFMYNSPFGCGVTEQLISLIDLYPTILDLLSIKEHDPEISKDPLHGKSILKERRQYVFSQNKYALQNDKARYNETAKSYSVVDGCYRLIVTALDKERKHGGLELYMEQFDPCDQIDLLSLFIFDAEGNIVGLNRVAIWRRSFLQYLPLVIPSGLHALADRFQRLRDELRIFVERKEQAASCRSDASPALFPKSSFDVPAYKWKEEGQDDCRDFSKNDLVWLKEQKRPILLYGMMPYAVQTFAVLRSHGVDIAGIATSRPFLYHRTMQDVMIYSLHEAAEKYPDAIVVDTQVRLMTLEKVQAACDAENLEYCSYPRDILGLKIT